MAFNNKNGVNCDLKLLDRLLYHCNKFVYQEQLEYVVKHTIAFVSDLWSERVGDHGRCMNALRGFNNLLRLAVAAKKHALERTFRLAMVCELIILDT